MIARHLVERGVGALMLLVVTLIGVSLSIGRFGIGADRQYFRDDFPRLAGDLDGFAIGLVSAAVAGFLMIAVAGVLFVTLRGRDSFAASIGAFTLLVCGVVMLLDAAAGRALYDLAREWREAGGVEGDTVWTSARAVALVYEALSGFAMVLIVGSLCAFGVAVVQQRVLPRGLGWLGIGGGALLLLGLALGGISDSVAWYLILGSGLIGLLWWLVAGAWLLLRGTGAPSLRSPV